MLRSQNFVGASSSGGHSINSHSSGTASVPASRSCAERILTRAKHEERTSCVPSPTRIVFQLLFGSACASFSTLIGTLASSCDVRAGRRPRPEFADRDTASVSGAQTVVVVFTPATYLRLRALISLLNFASTPYPAPITTTPPDRSLYKP